MIGRWMLAGLTLAVAACAAGNLPTETDPGAAGQLGDATLAGIEQRLGGRLGMALIDADGSLIESYRGEERFAMCSTFKLALAAAALARVDTGTLTLSEEIAFDESDLLEYAPVARQHLDEGRMTIAELAGAAVSLSDNTAANLLLERIGGPAALTAFVREQGDRLTRLDRNEPTLNENAIGDPRDTTTPEAMAGLVRSLALDSVLGAASRHQLAEWAVATSTGPDLIRAGIPDGWRIGDKTGNCGSRAPAINDVAIIWPSDAAPFVLAIYTDRYEADRAAIGAAFAKIATLAARQMSERSAAP